MLIGHRIHDVRTTLLPRMGYSTWISENVRQSSNVFYTIQYYPAIKIGIELSAAIDGNNRNHFCFILLIFFLNFLLFRIFF